MNWYLKRHVDRMFAGAQNVEIAPPIVVAPARPSLSAVSKTVAALQRAQRPLLLVGSQATLDAGNVQALADAVQQLSLIHI